MNLIGLMPAKNEQWVLKASAEAALKWLDGLVILNHASTDGTQAIIDELFAKYGCFGDRLEARHGTYPGRVWVLNHVDPNWTEMEHRQAMLECARRVGATHIAIVDADEILTGNLLGSVRDFVGDLEVGQILQFPLYNLRGSLDHYHETGLWGNRIVTVAFKDDPRLNWSGDTFHHREPMGIENLHAIRPVPQGSGGVLHLWGADLRRLQAKHALYKMTERLRWPEKPVETIDALYNLWRGPKPNDQIWRIGHVPSDWWEAHGKLKGLIKLEEEPWQEAECKSLYQKHGAFAFRGLDLFGCAENTYIRQDQAPAFSLCHATARLDSWQKAAQAWRDKCDNPDKVEYILAVDEGTNVGPLIEQLPFPNSRIVVNTKRRCSVDAWNEAAKASTGKFLINVADDLRPCNHWDAELLRAIPNLNQPCVLDVDTGGAAAGLLPFSFLTRKYLEHLTDAYGYEGGFFYPAYRGMYCDTEFTDLVRRDGILINARHLYFEHLHPFFQKGEMDATYHRQNAPEEYSYGKMIYDQRMETLGLSGIANEVKRFVMAVCLMGETFRYEWVSRWTELYAHFIQNWIVLPLFGYCSNVYLSRMTMAAAIEQYQVQSHLILWIDDDNLPTLHQVNQLIADLNEHPEADAVAGWCWINRGMPEAPRWGISCGDWDENGVPQEFDHAEFMAGSEDVKQVGWSGFPVVVMRRDLLTRAGGKDAFMPVLNEKHPNGFTGEDTGFWLHARNADCKVFVDRRVRVAHLKVRDDVPARPEDVTPKARLAGVNSGEGE
jgi:glycosyltransferase involved in cell wall biosynthesis